MNTSDAVSRCKGRVLTITSSHAAVRKRGVLSALDLMGQGGDDGPHGLVVLLANRSGLDLPLRTP